MHHLLAAAGLLKIGKPLDDTARVAAQAGGGAVGSQSVCHIVLAHGRDLDHKGALFLIFQHKAHAVLFLPDGQCTHISVLICQTEPYRLHVGGQLCGAQELIIIVQHQRCTLRQAVADLQLCLADVLLTTQIADVGHTDAGNDAHIRACGPGQTVDLARMAHAHLDHGILSAAFQPHQGAGHAQFIVLVALGLDGLAKACKGGVGHLLGGGLAHAAGHTHHLGVILAAVVRAHHHHGVVAVRAEDGLFRRHALHRVVHHHINSTVLQCFGRKIVAVKFFTRERYKNAAGPHLAAVGGHQFHLHLFPDEVCGHQPCQKLACRNFFHCSCPLSFIL